MMFLAVIAVAALLRPAAAQAGSNIRSVCVEPDQAPCQAGTRPDGTLRIGFCSRTELVRTDSRPAVVRPEKANPSQ